MQKQEWVVTIRITETEGDASTTQPWYYPGDVESLIRHTFVKAGDMRDLKIESIRAEENGRPYISPSTT